MIHPFWRHILSTLIWLLCFQAFSQIDPGTVWRVLETSHFKIIYDATQRETAERYALYAEVAYADLQPVFKEMPEKTTLVIQNNTDVANGFAVGFPYPYSVVYPTIPPGQQTIGEYGHWGQELVTHEFTHLLQFEPKHGFMSFLELIFGSIVTPNGLLPRWWLEGLAVETESQFSHGGRLRALRQQATLRALVLGKKLRREDIARVNESGIPDWLGGTRPYLFGSLLWNEIVSTKGNDSIHELNQRYSRRIPYWNVNTPIRDLTEKTYQEHLAEVYRKVEARASTQMQAIEKAKPTAFRPLFVEDAISHSATLSPNKKTLAYIERHLNHGVRLKLRRKKNLRSVSFQKLNSETWTAIQPHTRISWSPDSKSLVYDQLAAFDRYYNFSDLYEFKVEEKEIKRLTNGLRAREPAFAKNGKEIAFVRLFGDHMKLSVVDRKGENLRTIYTPPVSHRVSTPEFISEHQLVFTERDLQRNETLRLLDLKTKKVQTVLRDYSPVYNPRMTSAGLMFISGKTGVLNAYHARADFKLAKPITNTKTSVNSVDWDRYAKELIATELTPNGLAVAFTRGRKRARPPRTELTVPYKRKAYKTSITRVETRDADYSPWGYLIPRHWMPYALLSEGGLFLQASTSSHDPVGRHRYSLLGAFDTGTEKFNAAGSYTNSTTRVPITLSGYQYYDFFGGSSLLRKSTAASLTASGFVYGLSNNWRWSLGWDFLETDISSGATKQQGPSASLRYKNVRRRGKQVAPESGSDLLVSVTNYIESLGTVGYVSTMLNGSLHWAPSWYFDHHTFSFKWRSVYSPDNNNFFNGESTAGATYQTSLITSRLLMRGYLGGNFVAQSAINPSLEYSFPLFRSESGFGLLPLFSRGWSAKLFADVITLDGTFFDETSNVFRSTSMGTFYYGAGGQLHWSTTVGYHAPLEIFLGLYYGLNDEASGGFQTFLGFNL